jgi:hypothetical protein
MNVNPTPLRLGILGVGHFGRFHALKAAANPAIHLIGLHDASPERAAQIAGVIMTLIFLLVAMERISRRNARFHRPARHRGGLEQTHAPALSGKLQSTGQRVVASTDQHRVKAVRHGVPIPP